MISLVSPSHLHEARSEALSRRNRNMGPREIGSQSSSNVRSLMSQPSFRNYSNYNGYHGTSKSTVQLESWGTSAGSKCKRDKENTQGAEPPPRDRVLLWVDSEVSRKTRKTVLIATVALCAVRQDVRGRSIARGPVFEGAWIDPHSGGDLQGGGPKLFRSDLTGEAGITGFCWKPV